MILVRHWVSDRSLRMPKHLRIAVNQKMFNFLLLAVSLLALPFPDNNHRSALGGFASHIGTSVASGAGVGIGASLGSRWADSWFAPKQEAPQAQPQQAPIIFVNGPSSAGMGGQVVQLSTPNGIVNAVIQ